MIKSSINPVLTLDYMIHEDENKIFDRKSAQLKPSDIADEISAYANADGGTIVFGISDKTRRLEGINAVGAEKINNPEFPGKSGSTLTGGPTATP